MRLPENAFIQNDSQTMPSLLRAVDRNPSVSSTKREPMARSDPDSISLTDVNVVAVEERVLMTRLHAAADAEVLRQVQNVEPVRFA